MSDNFLQFSTELVALNKKERAWTKSHLDLFGAEAPQEGDKGYGEFTEFIGIYELEDETETLGFDWKFEDDNLWMYAELNGNPDHVAAFVQLFLKKFRPDAAFSMSFATTCSRPLIEEFGGGAVFVTAEKIEWVNAWDWCEEKWKEFRKRKAS